MRPSFAVAAPWLLAAVFSISLLGPTSLAASPVAAAEADAPSVAPVSPLPTPVDLRNLIYANDRAAVAGLLKALPGDTHEAQSRQRALFGVFSEMHPKVIAFADAWARDEPANPAALTARGWSLFSLGWTFRGEGYAAEVHPQAMDAFIAAHSEGLRLMERAAQLDPKLLAASDGILRMSYTIGRRDMIAPEVARIMDIAPNRFTMTLAGQANAPNWGGSIKAIELMCKAYAAKVTDRPGYGAEVCLVDGIMRSGAMTLDELKKMYTAIAKSDNPLILEWQDRDGDIQGKTAAEKLAHLDKIKAERPLSYLEANIYDQFSAQLATLTGQERPPEFPAAVARKAEDARAYADRNPGDWKGAKRLLDALLENRDVNGTEIDHAEFLRRAAVSLQINPFNADAWGHLGLSKLLTGGDEEAGIRAAEPYLINATAYSNHSSEHLKMLGGIKLGLLFRNMANHVKPADPQAWQDGILCPMVRQLRLLEAVCESEGKVFSECSGLPWQPEDVDAEIAELTSAGLCETEASMPLEALAYSPVQVDLSSDD